ncbi:thiolase family protein [Rhodococcus sp. IEGM 1307]|uniref:thiolase family protein n=1 Tax=Rhodococcus sp. IEGM 1307 TaxID=3047091 RepID=UPI0024B6E215|nr:thiolase family protein [Rhodococcus sp. IEGM 1307]MDI9979504.1 thiolase family protein [Rhodococcus sp. IEGM 1307]
MPVPVIAGAHTIPFVKESTHVVDLGADAVRGLLRSTGIDREAVDTVISAGVAGGALLGQRILSRLSMTGLPVFNIENACASGASAAHLAIGMVASGQARIVVVVATERLSALGGGALKLDPTDIEAAQGAIMPAHYALRANRYLWENGLKPEDLAGVSVKNRRNGALNPIARFQAAVTLEEVLNSKPIADPLTLLQCSPNSDGSSAVLICSEEAASELGLDAVGIKASVITSGKYSDAPRDLTMPDVTLRAIQQAYAQAGIGPKDLDLAEVHDAFSIAEVLYYEALGLCERGQGARYLAEGRADIDGDCAVNPSGGLISRGHPVGATGVAQLGEAYEQLTGRAGARQVPGASVALTHVTGGGIAGVDNGACGVHVLAV